MRKSKSATVAALLLAGGAIADPGEIAEIVVTAEFRPIRLEDQAASTSVVTADDIQQRAAQHLEDVLNVVPNVNFTSGSSRARFFQIRGIGERSQFQEPLNPSIGLVIDGIDFSGLGTAGTLFDVAQVEVLRGPQGTLHGANALAGLINIQTGAPQATPGLSVVASAAQYASWSAGLVTTGPLTDESLLYRVAFNSYRSDGYIDNDFLGRDDTNNRDETSARVRLRWLPSAADTLDLTVMYVDIDNGYDAFSLDNTRHTLADEPGRDQQDSSALGVNWHAERGALTVAADISYASSATNYSYDEDWTFVGIAPLLEYSSFDQYLRDRDSYSAQLRVLSNEHSRLFADRSSWVVGAYYLGDREQLKRRYTYLDEDFRSAYDTDTLALFGQLDTRLGGAFKLITGLRMERRSADYSDNQRVASDSSKTLWGGKLALEYTHAEDRLLYVSVSRGYRANGVNASILASVAATGDPANRERLGRVTTFDEEALLNYEAGFKARLLADTLSARLALFYMDRQDQQVKGSFQLRRADLTTNFIDYTNNAAQGNNLGLELELDWLASERLALYANIGLLDTEFEQYINADGVDLSGRDQAQAPAYQYAVGGTFDIGRDLYVRLDLEGRDSYFFSDRHASQSPAYELLHLRLGYDAEQWSLALWGRNLTDEDYYVRGFSFPNDPRKGYIAENYYQYGEPRVIGVSARYNF